MPSIIGNIAMMKFGIAKVRERRNVRRHSAVSLSLRSEESWAVLEFEDDVGRKVMFGWRVKR